MPCLCDEDRMFPLCWERAIFRAYCPVISVELGRVFPGIDHGFDREYHTSLHLGSTISISLVIDIGFLVEFHTYSVTRIFTDDRVSLTFSILRYLISDISEKVPRSYLIYTDHPGSLRDIDEYSGFLTDFPDHIHTRSIPEIPIDYRRDIDIEDISFLEGLISSGDTMTDDIIERYTGIPRVAGLRFPPDITSLIVDTCWYSSIREDESIHDLIELECSDPWLDIDSDHIEGTRCEIPRFSDSCYLLRSFDEDFGHGISFFEIMLAV